MWEICSFKTGICTLLTEPFSVAGGYNTPDQIWFHRGDGVDSSKRKNIFYEITLTFKPVHVVNTVTIYRLIDRSWDRTVWAIDEWETEKFQFITHNKTNQSANNIFDYSREVTNKVTSSSILLHIHLIKQFN